MNKLRKMEIIGKTQCSACHFREACKHSMNNGGEDYCTVLIDYVSKEEDVEERVNIEEELIDGLLNGDCETCRMMDACDYIQNKGGSTICSLAINEIKKVTPKREKKKLYTLRDLGFGDDDSIATYVAIGNTKGYLGTVFGVEGDWKAILSNVKEDGNIEYQTIKLKDLRGIKKL